MNKKELRQMIDSLTDDIEFDYDGEHGSICPFSRSDIVVGYGEREVRCSNIDEVMKLEIFNGKCIEDICDELFIY